MTSRPAQTSTMTGAVQLIGFSLDSAFPRKGTSLLLILYQAFRRPSMGKPDIGNSSRCAAPTPNNLARPPIASRATEANSA